MKQFLPFVFLFASTFTAGAAPKPPTPKKNPPSRAKPIVSTKPLPKAAPVLLHEGHGKTVLNMILAPDKKTLLVTAVDERFALDLSTGKAAESVKAIPGQAGSLSPDGREVLSPRYDFWLQFFNVQTGTQRAEVLPMAVGFPAETTWSPDAKTIAIASANQVDLLDAQSTKKIAQTIVPIGSGPQSLAFAPDGARLAVGFTSKTIELFSTREFDKPGITANTYIAMPRLKLLQTLSGHSGTVNVLRWSKDGNALLAGDEGGDVSIWDMATGQRRAQIPLASSGVTDLALAPSGQMVAVAAPDLSGSASLILCDIATGKPTLVWNGKNGGTKITARRLLFAPDGKSLLVGDTSGAVWQVPIGALERFSALAVTKRIDTGQRWALSGEVKSVQALAFSPDGRFLVAADHSGQLGRWNVETGEKMRLTSGHSRRITTIAFSPDGKVLASGGWSGLEATDWNTGKSLWRLEGLWGGVAGFTRDGQTLYASVSGVLKAFDAGSGKEIKSFAEVGGQAQKIALSPDGGHIAVAFVTGSRSGSAQETLQLWNVETARKEWEKPFLGYIKSLIWSSDSKWIAFDNGDRSEGYEDGYTFKPGKMGYSVLDAATGGETPLSNLNLKEPVSALAFAPSGKLLFVGSERLSEETQMRRLPAGQSLLPDATEPVFPPSPQAVAFSPDATLLAVGFISGPIQVLRVNK